MSSSLPSASQLLIVSRCPAALALPRVEEEAGEAAELGTGGHEFLEAAIKAYTVKRAEGVERDDALELAREAALEPIDPKAPHRSRCEALDLGALPLDDATEILLEAGFDVDLETGAVAFVGTGLRHGDPRLVRRPGHVVGVFDFVAVTPTEFLILDWKFGWKRPPPAKENPQILTGAVAISRLRGLTRGRAGIVRLLDDGRPRFDIAPLDAWDLGAGLGALRALEAERVRLEGVARAELPYARGEHCRYCGAWVNCHATTREIVLLARAPLSVEERFEDALMGTDPAAAVEALEAVELVVKRCRSTLMTYAANHPITFADGTVLGPVTVSKDKLDGDKVYREIERLHGALVAEVTVSRKATKKGIKAAARLVADKRKASAKAAGVPSSEVRKITYSATDEELRAACTAAGAIRSVPRQTVKRHRPGEAADDEGDDE